MQWSSKKFNREVSLLKSLATELTLHPLRQEQIKQRVLEQIGPVRIRASLSLKKQKALHYLAAGLTGLTLFGGTVFASEKSVPGDMLFPVKLTVEKVEAELARNEERKAKIEARHAENRLKEYEIIRTRVATTSPDSAAPQDDKNKAKGDKIKEETEARTETVVRNALETLTTVKAKLESKGNTHAAQVLEETIQRLKDKAESSTLHLEGEVKGEIKTVPGQKLPDEKEGQGPEQKQNQEQKPEGGAFQHNGQRQQSPANSEKGQQQGGQAGSGAENQKSQPRP